MVEPQQTAHDARPAPRRLALLALAVVMAGLVAAAPYWGASAAHAEETEATPCPDPGDDGSPCGPSCPCACCPGHAPTPAVVVAQCSVAAPSPSTLETTPHRALQSTDLRLRIFHPPRT
ncbi:MAG TPA: hypothetical protein PKJ99_14675 [Thermoanaerobaculales bacterium]|nr:hypothetical protein [Thermoanaerobaculales bacterium]HPA80559.1 hypothetical protein [Thermoanaerobaculales bacterium]HQL29353.1 hypothetical protein [Thermoanaerobaculales bacterium]HQP43063.1 hypothetical protein [Thermoanaerobaculales bacterium]